ncbi:MAG: hypothetical protein IT162_05960 [Bryobacterales bacterium]|nr:hypothetical protein [Bryobacterales bacterium]
MYGGKVERNDDGTYTSSHGHRLTKGLDGQLHSGGAPTGLSAGAAGGAVPTAWTIADATPGFGSQPRAQPRAFASWGASAPPYLPSFSSIPVYLWMGALALLAASYVSGSKVFASGLHWHPACGIAAVFTVILGYRYLMSWFPTALAVAMASTSAWALQVWLARHAVEARVLVPPTPPETFDAAASLAQSILHAAIAAPDPWVIFTVAAGVAVHFAYWRHRRRVVRQFGWPLNRGLTHMIKRLAAIGIFCVILGQLFVWLAPIRKVY